MWTEICGGTDTRSRTGNRSKLQKDEFLLNIRNYCDQTLKYVSRQTVKTPNLTGECSEQPQPCFEQGTPEDPSNLNSWTVP